MTLQKYILLHKTPIIWDNLPKKVMNGRKTNGKDKDN